MGGSSTAPAISATRRCPSRRPGRGEIVLKIEAALTCGTDVKTLRRGHPVHDPARADRLRPRVRGHGDRRGRRASRACAKAIAWWPRTPRRAARAPLCLAGRPNLCEDLLFVNGAYGEYIALPPRLVARNVVPLGRDVPAARAAFAEPLACALLGVERARVEAGQTVVDLRPRPARLPARDGGRAPARRASSWSARRAGASIGCARSASAECLDATAGRRAWRRSARSPGGTRRRRRHRRHRPARGVGAGAWTRWRAEAAWYSSEAARPERRSRSTRAGRTTRS